MAVVQKGGFRPIHHFLYPSKLQAQEINSHIQMSLWLFPGRHTEALAGTQKLQKKKSISYSNYKSCYKLSGAIDLQIQLFQLFSISHCCFLAPTFLSLFNCVPKLAPNLSLQSQAKSAHWEVLCAFLSFPVNRRCSSEVI